MITVEGLQLGSIAQVGTFLAVLSGLLTILLKFRGQTFDYAARQVAQYETTCGRLREDVSVLTERLIKCERDCAAEVRRMEQELLARDRQRVQEQISTINTIIDAVGDHPALKGLLRTFESVQVALHSNVLQTQVGNVIRPDQEREADDA